MFGPPRCVTRKGCLSAPSGRFTCRGGVGESHAGHHVMPYGYRNKSSGQEFCRFGRSRSCEAFVNRRPHVKPWQLMDFSQVGLNVRRLKFGAKPKWSRSNNVLHGVMRWAASTASWARCSAT